MTSDQTQRQDINQVFQFTQAQLKEARLAFLKPCFFEWGAQRPDQLPKEKMPEVAFIGRSNVGKSSLINTLTNRKVLARVSHTPGRTQQINFFNLGDLFYLVDLPGYGFAKVSKGMRINWDRLIYAYFQQRPSLAMTCILVDGRHGFKESDYQIMNLFDQMGVGYQIVFTKIDKVKLADQEALREQAQVILKRHPAAYPEALFVSSHDKKGFEVLQARILQQLNIF